MSELSQPMFWPETELPSMSSAEGSPVRTSARSERALELAVSRVVFGETTPDWLVSFDRNSSSWRTAQTCFVEGLATFSETWPSAGMMRSGRCSQLAEWVPHTHETACFFWHTPTSNDKKPAGTKEME